MKNWEIIISSRGMCITESMKEDGKMELEKLSKYASLLHRIELSYHYVHKKFFTHVHLHGPSLNLEAKSEEHDVLHASLTQAVQKASRQLSKVHE